MSECSVPGCTNPPRGAMCRKHAERVRRHGDAEAFTHQKDRNLPRGAANVRWTGDGASYFAVHQRVKKVKGSAASHPCAECGERAKHWSYDHADPNERTSDTGSYSVDLDHYRPLCVPCHKASDLDEMARQGRQLGAPLDLDAVRRLHAQGVRARSMSRQLGVAVQRITRALDELGLTRFPPGAPRGGVVQARDALATLGDRCPPTYRLVADAKIADPAAAWPVIAERCGITTSAAIHRYKRMLTLAEIKGDTSAAPGAAA